MERIHFEVSAINHAVNGGWSALSLRQRMAGRGQIPVIGLQAICELAKTFLDSRGTDRGKSLFRFVHELDPSYTPSIEDFLNQEIAKLRSGSAVLPFLDHVNQAATRTEVARLALGDFDTTARRFLASQHQAIQGDHPRMMEAYIHYVQQYKQRRSKRLKGVRTFEHIRRYFDPQIPEIIQSLFRRRVTPNEARELSGRLDSFPALRSLVNVNLFLMFVCITQGVVPNTDKIDDHQHIIEASYDDAIVLEDEQLRRNANHISTDIKILSLADLLSSNLV